MDHSSRRDLNPRERFSSRVADYSKYRPGYPPQIIELLKSVCGLNKETIIADIGSGTGIMTELLLPHCNKVYAVEPNDGMRRAAERQLGNTPGFVSVAGSAEETTLHDRSADIVVAAQAFHWFNRNESRKEFGRILKRNGWIVLVWNSRQTAVDEFHQELENLLTGMCPEYPAINHRNIGTKDIEDFVSPDAVIYRTLFNEQNFDWEGLRGRLLSASYVPKEGDPQHDEFMARAKGLFDRFQKSGKISLHYITEIYLSHVTDPLRSPDHPG